MGRVFETLSLEYIKHLLATFVQFNIIEQFLIISITNLALESSQGAFLTKNSMQVVLNQGVTFGFKTLLLKIRVFDQKNALNMGNSSVNT